jgi:hypothetical protein
MPVANGFIVGRNSEAYCAGYANLELDVEWETQ